MNEKQVVNCISKIFTKNNRQYFNIKGDAFGNKAGTPDFLTMDINGRFVGLEIKAPSGKPYPNQLRRGREILESGGRYVVAYPDFSIEDLDNETIPKVTFVDEEMTISKTTTEIIL